MDYSPAPSLVDELWSVLCGCFGSDAMARKFGKTPPPEWRDLIGGLKPYELSRGVRRLGYSGKRDVPSLPEFLKLCRAVSDEADGPISQPLALEAPEGHGFDRWEQFGNLKLLRHVTQGIPLGRRYDRDATMVLVEQKRLWAQEMREAAAENALPADGDDTWWADRMRRAEEQIRARYQQAAA